MKYLNKENYAIITEYENKYKLIKNKEKYTYTGNLIIIDVPLFKSINKEILQLEDEYENKLLYILKCYKQ